jgi:hypothetical protein
VTISGGNITAIADQTGNFTLSQSNSGYQPSYISSDYNGKPGLRFSGGQYLTSSASLGTGLNSDTTIITVGTIPTSTAGVMLYI